ncbi:hypothetical protein PINS_up009372 [Pythium insidiosum]|nr:hypothetical protein PINS_up009372 [Pythium insidiosum]
MADDNALVERRPRTSSERGRAFRERQKRRHAELLESIQRLKKEIREKTFLKNIWEAKYLRSRHSQLGSLASLVREYYDRLRFGIPANATARELEDFVTQVTCPDIVVGDLQGRENLVEQWRRYTMAHRCYEGYLTDVDIIGAEECPIVVADIKIEARLHRSNIALLFPNVLSDEALVQRLIGQKVTYRGRSYVRFSPDGRIQEQWLNVSFIGGLLRVCGNVEDVARLLDHSPISALGTIHVDPRRPSSRDIAEQVKEVEWSEGHQR